MASFNDIIQLRFDISMFYVAMNVIEGKNNSYSNSNEKRML